MSVRKYLIICEILLQKLTIQNRIVNFYFQHIDIQETKNFAKSLTKGFSCCIFAESTTTYQKEKLVVVLLYNFYNFAPDE